MSEKKISVDRTITLTLIFAIAVQTASALHWGGATEARLDALEEVAQLTHPLNVRLARMEEQMDTAQNSLGRIETRLNVRDK